MRRFANTLVAQKWLQTTGASVCYRWCGSSCGSVSAFRATCPPTEYTPEQHSAFMREAVEASYVNMRNNTGGPFGCVVVKDGEVIARGSNSVIGTNDPTAHAEVVAIRNACKALNTFQLDGCTIYTSCEPCPMCLSAIYWARPERVYFANTKIDAAAIEFDDKFIYEELAVPMEKRSIPCERMEDSEAIKAFQEWDSKKDRTEY